MLDVLRSFFAPPISADPTQSKAKLLWVVRLRWIALVAQLLTVIPALKFQLLEEPMLPFFFGVIALLAAVNLVTWAAMRRGSSVSPGQVLFQLCTDIGALSVMLGMTGGAWNPLVPILFVHTGLGALLLEGQLSLIFFAFLIACLVSIQAHSHIPVGLEGSLVPAPILFPAQLLVALVFWILTAWLSRTLTSLQSHFAFLRERKDRIDRLRAVGALAAGLSHELATPLNTAQLRLRRLARKEGLAEHPDVETASEALDRCEDVLRYMAGAPLRPEGLNLEAVNVDQLVQRVCRSVSAIHEGVSIRVKHEGRGPRSALLPDVAFSQALINLIDNALESAGSSEPVEVVVGSQPGRIDVSVLDRGGGWPQVVRTHLGEPFVTTKPDGVGLGLYYVHSLAEAVGAEFTLEDREEGGAAARISLPSVSPGNEASA